MVFHGNKNRLLLFRLSGYLLCGTLFFMACSFNWQGVTLKAHMLLLASFLAFIIIFISSKKLSQGVLIIDEQGIMFSVGLRQIDIAWDNIEDLSILEHRRGRSIGLKLKNLDFATASLKRLFELNEKQSSYHVSFKDKSFEDDLDAVFACLSGYLKDVQSRKVLTKNE